jgi:hypothetical protein
MFFGNWSKSGDKKQWRRPCFHREDFVLMTDSWGRNLAQMKSLDNMGIKSESKKLAVYSYSGMSLQHTGELLKFGKLKSDAALNLSDRKEQERKLFEMQFKAKRDGEWRKNCRKLQKKEVKHQFYIDRKDAKINRKRWINLHRYGDKIDKKDRRMPGSYKDQTRVAHRYPDDFSNDKRKRDGRCMEKCEGDMKTQAKCL